MAHEKCEDNVVIFITFHCIKTSIIIGMNFYFNVFLWKVLTKLWAPWHPSVTGNPDTTTSHNLHVYAGSNIKIFWELQWNSVLKLHWGESKVTNSLIRGSKWGSGLRGECLTQYRVYAATITLSQSWSQSLEWTQTYRIIKITKYSLDSWRWCLRMTRKWEKTSWIPTCSAAA